MIDLRVITDPDEVKKIVPVISSAWGMPNMASALQDVVNTMRFHGGLVQGAYDGDNMVGMQFAYPGFRHGKLYLYSHMTGVLEKKKYSGIGYKMKMFQKDWALKHGYDLIAWTFDPARSLNAYFNIHKLGAMSRTLLPEFYGRMDDELNSGLPTDRLVAEWWIKDDCPSLPKDCKQINEILPDDSFKLLEDPSKVDETALSIQTISDITSLLRNDKSKAISFKNALSSALQVLFSRKYVILDFARIGNEVYYLLYNKKLHPAQSRENMFSFPSSG